MRCRPTMRRARLWLGWTAEKAAVNPACWAIDEAVSRDVPMRLIHVVEPDMEASRESWMRQKLRSRPLADR